MDKAHDMSPESAIQRANTTVRIDHATITRLRTARDGSREVELGSVRGWAVCPEPLARIDVLLNDRLVTTARIGDLRSDIAALFPGIGHAGQSGFEAILTSGRLPPGAAEVVLRLQTIAGRSLTVAHPLTIAVGTRDLARLPIRMAVDHCGLDAQNRLHLSGWVLAAAPIAAIQVFIGADHVATITQNHARPDVAALFPNYPHAEQQGFALVRQLPPRGHAVLGPVRIEAITRDGATQSTIVPARFDPTLWTSSVPPAKRAGASAQLHCDTIALDTGGAIRIEGWAVAPDGVAKLSVFLDDAALGDARLGLPRSDVGRIFPNLPHTGKAGFVIAATMPGPLAGAYDIRFELTARDGAQNRFVETAAALEGAVTQANQRHGDIMMAIDGMQIEAGHAARRIGGGFTLLGWAIARAGVATVEVFLGERSIGQAHHGLRREDVAAAFPHVANAVRGGFVLSIPARALTDGRALFRVVTTARDGAQAEFRFTADIAMARRANSPQALRLHVSAAELATHQAILEARGPLPTCDLALRLPADREAAPRALATLASLVSQAYGPWRLWLSPATGQDGADLRETLLAAHPDQVDRILLLADYDRPAGPFLAGLLAAGDTLAADGLLAMVMAAGGRSGGDLIYGDDLRRNGPGQPPAAFFKPDWSPDLLLSQNYIGRAWLVRSGVLSRAGLDLPALAAGGEYAALLRLTETAATIRHVPHLVLQADRSRIAPGLERRALTQALRRRAIAATVSAGRRPDLHHVRRRCPHGAKVSIIIPSIAAKGHIRACIDSIRRLTEGIAYEIVIVDNLRGRTLTTEQRTWKAWFRANADIVVPLDAAFNWSKLNNAGAAAASGDHLLFLNDDIDVQHHDWLTVLAAEAARPEVGVVGAQLLYPDGRVQHAGMILSRTDAGSARHAFRFTDKDDPGYFGLALSQRNVACVTGACMMMRREIFETAGGFDEAHRVVNNDVDFCLRLHRAGKLIVYTPHVQLIHHEMASRAGLNDAYDKPAFQRSWGELCLAGDPFHNRNLGSEGDGYAIEDEPLREIYAGHPLGRRDEVRRILAIKLDHIGDLVTALPALRRLKSLFPLARLEALVGPSAIGIAKLEPAIDEIIPFAFFEARSGLGRKALRKRDYAGLAADLKARRYDLAIDLRKLGDTRHILEHAHAKILAGFDREQRFPWLDIALEWEGDTAQAGKRGHIGDDLLNLVDAVGSAFREDRLTIQPRGALPALSKELVRDFGALFARDYVVVHPAAGTPLRQWPSGYFARLIDLLVERDGMRIALIGGPDERGIADAVLGQVKHADAVFDVVGRSRLAELPEILARSVLFVGNNSGPSHIAAGLGVPTVAVHSAIVASEEWGPLGPAAVALRRDMSCAPCYIVSTSQCHRAMACLTSISPHAVHAICQRFLSLRAGAGLEAAPAHHRSSGVRHGLSA